MRKIITIATLLACNIVNASLMTDAVRLSGVGGSYDLWLEPQSYGDSVIFLSVADLAMTMTHEGGALPHQADWYVVNVDDEFTPENISLDMFSPYEMGSSIPLAPSFYLGVTASTLDLGYGARNSFGWAKFGYELGGELTLQESAVAYESGGIEIGTHNVIPEPSSALLMLVAGAGGWMFRRKLRR
ncbi:hypothetical protein PDESU_00371 [Pontiella desulfatans]|uniref:Ice-binding protein C-terminal domain-containing protein n=1 Tax=Pontiella desulfatans TaxID=2750659 RepID=A0A6C2TWE9_PONDE|nr:PEP-CTERM sorting domain-containing protein [Pontiella desulfatans]VGO11824.1 hypothetical protein PDESU_00371 [Pontiella desulfatans]